MNITTWFYSRPNVVDSLLEAGDIEAATDDTMEAAAAAGICDPGSLDHAVWLRNLVAEAVHEAQCVASDEVLSWQQRKADLESLRGSTLLWREALEETDARLYDALKELDRFRGFGRIPVAEHY